MSKLGYAIFAGLVLSLVGGATAQADPINGSEVIGGTVAGPFGDLASQTTFDVSLFTLNGTLDYLGIPSPTDLGSATLDTTDTTSLGSFTFGNSAFGFFTATSGTEEISPTNTRTFLITGSFVPGSLFPNTLASNSASILITLNQVNGAGNAIGWNATFNTPSVVALPEPSTLGMTGISIVALGLFHRLRIRRVR